MAVEVLTEAGITLPAIVSLAKQEELICFPDGRELRLPRRDPGLKLLQYVRDEAHRFCRRYLHLLQRKELDPQHRPVGRRRRNQEKLAERKEEPKIREGG